MALSSTIFYQYLVHVRKKKKEEKKDLNKLPLTNGGKRKEKEQDKQKEHILHVTTLLPTKLNIVDISAEWPMTFRSHTETEHL